MPKLGCCIPNCTATGKDRLFHRFPNPQKHLDILYSWLDIIGVGELRTLDPKKIYSHKRVCSDHFEQKYKLRNNRLQWNAIPTLRREDRMISKDLPSTSDLVTSFSPKVGEVVWIPESLSDVKEVILTNDSQFDIQELVLINDSHVDDILTYGPRLTNKEYKVNFTFRGHVAPVFTPFNNDRNKSINLKIIFKYATYLLDNEVKGVLVNGTSGEGMSMTVQERKMLAEEWKKSCNNTHQMLMVQVGGAPLPDVLELATHAESIKVDAILCLPELYIKPKNADELIRYLSLVSKAAPKTPLLYYHIPGFTNVNINMAEFLEKAKDKIDTLVGIKFTSTDLVEGANCLTVNDGKYAIFLGADQLLSAAYTLGFDSAIATTFNLFPHYGNEILNNIKTKVPNLRVAREKQRSLTNIINSIIKHGGWVPTMKTAMNKLSPINLGPVREPMEQLSPEEMQKMQIPIE